MEENRLSPFTVSKLTAEIRGLLEPRFTKIYVEAEISGFRLYPSGHAYFTLKDEGAQLSAVMFASSLQRCKAREQLQDGAKVIVYGNVSVYPPRGNYQFVVLAAKLAGMGDLMQKFLELKAKLAAEGLFDSVRKRPLPFLPRHIGIVTSEAGAVIHDMATVLTRRFPALEIRLYPSLVQGEAAPATIIAGLEFFNRAAADGSRWPDLIIVARGGGSFEDLFCFNDERLVRAVAASAVPVISAVGHETDFTLCDFAADRRAGTPSIAAEIAVPVYADLLAHLGTLDGQLVTALRRRGEFFAQRLDHLSEALRTQLTVVGERLQTRVERLAEELTRQLSLAHERLRNRVERADDRLRLLSPYGVLDRGYSLTTAADGTIIRHASQAHSGERITTRLAEGSIASVVQ